MNGAGAQPDTQGELTEARERMMLANAARHRVEWLVREDPALRSLRLEEHRLGREEHLAALEMMLVGWDGEGLPPFPAGGLTAEFISAGLPVGDVTALGAMALTLLAPTKEAAGN
jgi:hypothetical protein